MGLGPRLKVFWLVKVVKISYCYLSLATQSYDTLIFRSMPADRSRWPDLGNSLIQATPLVWPDLTRSSKWRKRDKMDGT